MNADALARRYLLEGNQSKLSRESGITIRTLYNRRQQPGKITLDELAGLARAREIDAEELWKVVMSRR